MPIPTGTLVRFPKNSTAFRTSLPDQDDENSGQETEFVDDSLAITVGTPTEPGSLMVHWVDPAIGAQVTALYRCSSDDVQVLSICNTLEKICKHERLAYILSTQVLESTDNAYVAYYAKKDQALTLHLPKIKEIV